MLQIPLIHLLVVLSAIMMLVGGFYYTRDTLAGRTKPNRVSWSMWALAPLISAGAALSSDADGWATVRVVVGGIVPLVIFLASFVNRQSYWRLSSFDISCGVLSVVALIAWGLVDSPKSAILLATVGNTFASIPTLLKAWRYPETETKLIYVTSFISTLLILPAIPVWNIENAAFQMSLLISTAAMVFAVYRTHLFPVAQKQ
jgi:hypothetical protein